MIGQLEQAHHRAELLPRQRLRVSGRVKVGPADVADEQRVAAEDEPGLLRPAPPVGNDEGEVGGRMPGRRNRTDDRVPELDDVAVGKRLVLELDACVRGEVGGRTGRLDERREAGYVIGLDVRLEDGRDRRARPLGGVEVALDELDVRVDDRELRVRETPEQVAGAGRLVVEEGAQDHLRFQRRL